HNLYEVFLVNKVEAAVLTELLLRGPQTEGELRGRASRMEPINDLESLRALLRPLTERRLVVYLSPEGRRGTMLTHGFHSPEDPKPRRPIQSEAARGADPEIAAPAPGLRASRDERLTDLEPLLAETTAEIAALRLTVAELQGSVTRLAEQLGELRAALGA